MVNIMKCALWLSSLLCVIASIAFFVEGFSTGAVIASFASGILVTSAAINYVS